MPSYREPAATTTSARTGKLYPNDDPEHSDGTVVMFDERFNTDDGLAHLVPAQWLPAKELPDEEYPFVLNTGRLLEHWHTGSMTRRSFALDAIAPGAEVYMQPRRRRRAGPGHGELGAGDARGAARSSCTSRCPHREGRGNCFIPFHFREAAANLLTIDEIDPFGQDPRVQVLRRPHRAAGSRRVSTGRVRRPRVWRRGPGRFPGPEPDPGAERDPGAARLAAPRGARGAVARHATAAVRDRGAGLVLPALPHGAAARDGRRTSATTCRAGCAVARTGIAEVRTALRRRTPTSRSSRCPAWAGATSRPPWP